MDRRRKSVWDTALSDLDAIEDQVEVVHKFPMDDIEVEIGKDEYGNLFVRTRTSVGWITCIGLEHALAKEVLRLHRSRDEERG